MLSDTRPLAKRTRLDREIMEALRICAPHAQRDSHKWKRRVLPVASSNRCNENSRSTTRIREVSFSPSSCISLAPHPGALNVKTFREWLAEGEQLYNNAMTEFHTLEKQLEQLEQQLAAKKAEVNQIAGVIGKSPIDSSRRLNAQLVDASVTPVTAPPPTGGVARALGGGRVPSNGVPPTPPSGGWNVPR
jgi:hypothetical protein